MVPVAGGQFNVTLGNVTGTGVDVDSTGNVALGTIAGGNNAVDLDSTGGSVTFGATNSGLLTADGQAGIAANGAINATGAASLNAATGNISGGNSVTASGLLTVQANGAGGAVTLGNVSGAGVNVDSVGNIILGTITGVDGAAVDLNSNGGGLTFGASTSTGTFTARATGALAAGTNDITATGVLQLTAEGGNVTAGSLTGAGVTVNAAGNTITLASTIDSQNGVTTLAADALVGTNGLNIQDSADVNLNVQTATISGGSFTIDNDITGRINAANLTAITVQGAGSLTWKSSVADVGANAAIDVNNAVVQAGSISLTTTNEQGSINQGAGGSFTVNANGGDISLSQTSAVTIGDGGFRLAGNKAFIDLNAESGAGTVIIEGTNTFNSLAASGTLVVLAGDQTADGGAINLTSTSDRMDVRN